MVQLQHFFFLITSMVVPRGTAAPVLLKWFVTRDVPTGAPFSNGTIIPILIPSLTLLVYLHSRKFIRSTDRAKSRVKVRASRPILLPDIIGRSSSETRARNALFRFVPVLHFLLLEDNSYLESFCGVLCLLFFRTFFFLPRDRSAKRERARRRKGLSLRPNGNEQRRNEKMRCPGHPHFERRVEVFRPVYFPVPSSSGGACVGDAPPEIGLEALTLPRSLLMAVDHDDYQKAPMKMNISHSGVWIFMLGVLLSSTNTKKIVFTQRLPLGSELHMGKERCCLRGLDHLHGPTFHGICGNLLIYKPSLTNDGLIFEHDESDLLPINFPTSYENGKLEQHRWMKNREQNHFWLTMFPEKRYFRERTSTTEVAIHTNLFTDLYALIGTGSSRTGGWYTTIMKLPFLFFIRIGFMLASLGGSRSLLRQLKRDKLHWN
ncbi:hypothetical protein M569_00101 [Genlisea aurea]|uniref:Cytochrome c-type biogenesis protein CcmF C-terminal domain-containing protein n=1 Tax=Genlisea aurea TaxID=192259 RepID=S8EP08_9LAMI|nr:hypothetical protein M569_00101 [Genlisea aurea]